MKKLMVMLGAVAMAFGLFADATPFAASFESGEDGVNIPETGKFTPQSASGWTWAGDPLTLATYDGDDYDYEASGHPRQDAFDGDNDQYLTLETSNTDELVHEITAGNVFVDQLVKFTGFEDPQTNATALAGTKIAVWMSEFVINDETEATETNLYVTVGKELSDDPVAVKIDGNFELGKWYRLTIKSIGDISSDHQALSARAGFVVYIDGNKATIAEDDPNYNALITSDSALTSAAASAFKKHALMPAISFGDSAVALASVGYKGIGAIDDLVINDQDTDFTVDTVDVTFKDLAAATIVTVVDEEGEVIPVGDVYTVKPGELTVTLAAKRGWILSTNTIKVDTADAVDGVIELDLSDIAVKAAVILTRQGVETPYTQEQFEALLLGVPPAVVKDGDVITVLKAIDREDEGVMLYAFSTNTTIAVTDVGTAPGVTAVKWDVTIPDVEGARGMEPGSLTFNLGLEAEKQVSITFTGDNADDGEVIFNGPIADGAILKVNNGSLTVDDGIVLTGTAKVYEPTGEIENITDGEKAIDAELDTETGLYVYAIPAEPTTWEATIDLDVGAGVNAPTAKVDGEGADVDISTGKYEVPAGSTLVVTYTAETGYQFETDVATKSFTLTEENPSCECPTATAISYTITYIYKGTPLENLTPATYTVVSGATLPVKGVVELPEGAEFEGWYDNDAFTGDAVTAIAAGSIGNTNFYAKAKVIAPADPTKDKPEDIPTEATAATYFPNVSAEIKATGIKARDLATWCQGAAAGTVAPGGSDIKLDAYKLDCANTTGAINAAKENFKFTAADLAKAMAGDDLTTLNSMKINGTLEITTWADPAFTVEYTDGAACFYKAEVKVPGEK